MTSQEFNSDSLKEKILDLGIYYLDMVECPLDPSHKLRRHRLPYHLIKCKKNFPDKIRCPYGHYYYLNKQEMANHLLTCLHKPKLTQAEMQPHIMQTQYVNNKNVVHNYDVDNYTIDEPYWD